MLKEFLEAALDGEMSSHLDDSERLKGNKRNGRGSKRVKTMAGEIDIVTPQDRHSSFSPEILKKRETILADNMSSKIISLYGMGLSLRDISSHIEEMYDVEISHNTLSEIIERIVPKVKEWQSRPLESMYTIVWLVPMPSCSNNASAAFRHMSADVMSLFAILTRLTPVAFMIVFTSNSP